MDHARINTKRELNITKLNNQLRIIKLQNKTIINRKTMSKKTSRQPETHTQSNLTEVPETKTEM